MILIILLNIQMICVIFIKTLKNTTHKKRKILIVFDDLVADMLKNKKLDPIITELFIRGRQLNIFFLLHNIILLLKKNIRLNSTHYFIMKIPNKRELQKIAFDHSSDIDFQDFMYLYKKYSGLAIVATLASDNPLRFRKNILEKI